jgi:hypothetical protein
MSDFQRKLIRLAVAAICGLGTLAPGKSFADLNNLACNALWRGCLANCGAGGNTEACTEKCDDNLAICTNSGSLTKQQTPPPPCTGVKCSLRNPHPPTTVSNPPATPRRPVRPAPAKPGGVSNPNQTSTSNPVILERKNDSGGGQKHGH